MYCDRTMRRSSSAARGSSLPDRSTAPPLVQYCCQCSRDAACTVVTSSGSDVIGAGENHAVSSMRSAPLLNRYWCLSVWTRDAPADHLARMK